MALKATIYKIALQIADMDRNHFQNYPLTVAQHPSETDTRMMIRLLAFALNASDSLSFTKGISTDDEPDIWDKNLTDEINLWIDLGQPDEKRLRKACGRAKHVIVYCYQQRSAELWWKQMKENCHRFENLSVYCVDEAAAKALGELADRNMQIQCTIEEGDCWVSASNASIQVHFEKWK